MVSVIICWDIESEASDIVCQLVCEGDVPDSNYKQEVDYGCCDHKLDAVSWLS